MNVPPGSGEFEGENELERLRRRAYGPNADIAGDATAQVRLSELEAAQRRKSTPDVEAASTSVLSLTMGVRRACAALALNAALVVWLSQLLGQASIPPASDAHGR